MKDLLQFIFVNLFLALKPHANKHLEKRLPGKALCTQSGNIKYLFKCVTLNTTVFQQSIQSEIHLLPRRTVDRQTKSA